MGPSQAFLLAADLDHHMLAVWNIGWRFWQILSNSKDWIGLLCIHYAGLILHGFIYLYCLALPIAHGWAFH